MFNKISPPLSHDDAYTDSRPIRPAAKLTGNGQTTKHR